MTAETQPPTLLYAGKHVHFLKAANGWEYVHRPNARQGVAIVAVTPEDRIVLVSQLRTPLGKHALELPAGLVGDGGAGEAESPEVAARRELLEETGYTCEKITILATAASSPGLTDEVNALCLAEGLHGDGVAVEPLAWPAGAMRQVKTRGLAAEGEAIAVYEIPLAHVGEWLARESARQVVDLKVYAGLYFLGQRRR